MGLRCVLLTLHNIETKSYQRLCRRLPLVDRMEPAARRRWHCRSQRCWRLRGCRSVAWWSFWLVPWPRTTKRCCRRVVTWWDCEQKSGSDHCLSLEYLSVTLDPVAQFVSSWRDIKQCQPVDYFFGSKVRNLKNTFLRVYLGNNTVTVACGLSL